MTKAPFTPAGVQQKLSELYALADSDLATQANLLQSDFRQWVKDNFTLDSAQSTYLDGMDDRWIKQAASQSAFAVQNRLPINLTTEPPQPASKLVRTTSHLIAENGPNGFVPSGSLTFEILYEDV